MLVEFASRRNEDTSFAITLWDPPPPLWDFTSSVAHKLVCICLVTGCWKLRTRFVFMLIVQTMKALKAMHGWRGTTFYPLLIAKLACHLSPPTPGQTLCPYSTGALNTGRTVNQSAWYWIGTMFDTYVRSELENLWLSMCCWIISGHQVPQHFLHHLLC